MKTRQVYVQVTELLALILLFVACGQAPAPPTLTASTKTSIQQTRNGTPPLASSPTPLGGASAQLGLLPRCQTGPTPQEIPQITSAVGTFPVWAAFAKAPLTLEWTHDQATQFHTQYGWSHKFLWIIDATYKGLITLHGANVYDGTPLLPEADEPAPTSILTSLVLNPQNSATPPERHIGHWIEFPGGLTIPKAGCYQLNATWSGGSWQAVFAAGEVST